MTKSRNSLAGFGRLWKLFPVFVVGIAIGVVAHWAFSPALLSSQEPASSSRQEQTSEQIAYWTCSMHPQIHMPKPGLCPICSMKLIPVRKEAGSEIASMREFTTSESAKALMDIETAPVERKFVTAAIRMVGKVEYDESRLAYIAAWVSGRLDRLYVDYTGVSVNKGDHMVYMYSPELLSAQEELLQAMKSVQRIKAGNSDIMRDLTTGTLDAVREKLRLLGLSTEQIAEVEKRGSATDHITIYAPISGIVVHKNALEGMYVNTGTRIYTVADLSHVWVKLDAYESDLSWLRFGQQVEFTTVSLPGQVFMGTISFIDPVLDPVTRTVKIRVDMTES
jgi:Cu(I)/Ag(I) efflux system membrane fusion protein